MNEQENKQDQAQQQNQAEQQDMQTQFDVDGSDVLFQLAQKMQEQQNNKEKTKHDNKQK